jgi:hypothetical protein
MQAPTSPSTASTPTTVRTAPAPSPASSANGGTDFPVILDDGAISRDYRVQAIPTLVVIRPDGVVEEAHVGLLHQDASAIAESIGEMIEAARKVQPGA